MRINPLRGQSGFTLTELLVVLVILSLLAAALTPQVMGRLDSSKVRAAKLQVSTLAAALDMYKIDTGRYPTEEEGLVALVTNPDGSPSWDGPYVKSMSSLSDPWGRAFDYRSTASAPGFQLISFGADGLEGGERHAQDLLYPDFTVSGP